MYATIRRYDLARNLDDAERTSVQERFIPRLQSLDGFVDYYFVVGDGRTLVTVSVFESADQAARSTEVAAAFIREESLDDALPSPPQVTVGEVVAHGSRTTALA